MKTTESKHTPGPWTKQVEGRFNEIEAGDWPIAHVYGMSEQSHANACLIAAAPELLAFAKKIIGDRTDAECATGTGWPNELFSEARAAIAKAEQASDPKGADSVR